MKQGRGYRQVVEYMPNMCKTLVQSRTGQKQKDRKLWVKGYKIVVAQAECAQDFI